MANIHCHFLDLSLYSGRLTYLYIHRQPGYWSVSWTEETEFDSLSCDIFLFSFLLGEVLPASSLSFIPPRTVLAASHSAPCLDPAQSPFRNSIPLYNQLLCHCLDLVVVVWRTVRLPEHNLPGRGFHKPSPHEGWDALQRDPSGRSATAAESSASCTRTQILQRWRHRQVGARPMSRWTLCFPIILKRSFPLVVMWSLVCLVQLHKTMFQLLYFALKNYLVDRWVPFMFPS